MRWMIGMTVVICAALAACGDAARDAAPGADAPAEAPAADAPAAGAPAVGAPAVDEAATTTLRVYFTKDERPEAVGRQVPRTRAVLRAALLELLQGPSAEEQAAGVTSFFSPATAGMLRRVAVDERGRATVDLADFSRVIPGASSSAGSAMLLGELNATVFQFPTVREVEYRFEGDCDAFWTWLQRSCRVVARS